MDRRSRRRIEEFEELVSAALKRRDEQLRRFLREAPTHARRHASAVAAIVLAGKPRIDEPLKRAWARALEHFGIKEKDQIAAAVQLYPIVTKKMSGSERFTEIFSTAPVWLLQFTAMPRDAGFLGFDLPDISETLQWGSAGFEDAQHWPLLPSDTMTAGAPIPESDGRRFWIAVNCQITVPFSTLKSISPREEKILSRGDRDQIELLEYFAELERRPESEWAPYEKRRVRRLCERLVRNRRHNGTHTPR